MIGKSVLGISDRYLFRRAPSSLSVFAVVESVALTNISADWPTLLATADHMKSTLKFFARNNLDRIVQTPFANLLKNQDRMGDD